MQQRYYDPGIGMFLSVDPVTAHSNPVGQFHRYRYANNNPYMFTDPDGRQSESVMDRRYVYPRLNSEQVKGIAAQHNEIGEQTAKGMAAGAAGATIGAVAVKSGAVAATVSTAGKVVDAAGKMATAANAKYTTGGIAAYAMAGKAAQTVVAKANAVATAVGAKMGEAKVAVMTSPVTTGALKHMDNVMDAVSGYFGKGPPPMTPAGAAGGAVAGAYDEIKD